MPASFTSALLLVAASFTALPAQAFSPTALAVRATNQALLALATTTAKVTLSDLSVPYDGSAQTPVATTNPSGLTVDFTFNGSATAPTTPGKYAVVATIDDPNYTGTAKGTFVITKATATVTLGNLAATYDGNPHPASASTSPSGLTVDFTYNHKAVVPVNVGSYLVTATVSDANYQAVQTGTLVIAKAAASVSVPDISVNYDAKAQSDPATTDPSGLPLTYVYTLNGKTTAPVGVGTYTVTATVKSPNAQGSGTGTLTISAAYATVTIADKTAVYTGHPIVATATTTPPRLALAYTYDGSATAPTAVGTYAVTATVSNPNYTGSASATLTITPVPPVATTGVAKLVTANSATLTGVVNPRGSGTTASFQIGTSAASYGGLVGSQSIGNGSASVATSYLAGSLASATTYHYRVVATNGTTTVYGADHSFRTLAAPVIGTTPATPLLSASGAQVGFSVTPGGVATSVHFIYGTSSGNLNLSTATQTISAAGTTSVTGFLPDLAPNTTYYYEVVTTGPAGTYTSVEGSFTTLAFDTSVVAKDGDTANGTGGALYSGFGYAAINNQDGVVFAAGLKIQANNPTIGGTNDLGIWANEGSDTLALVAQTGTATPAPGTSGATYISLGDPIYNNNSAVAFGGQLKIVAGQATATTNLGVWSTIGGSLQLIARTGQASNVGSTFNNFDSVALSDANVIVVATLALNTADSITTANEYGIWEGTSSSNLTARLRTGDEDGSGHKITAFTIVSSQTLIEGQTRCFASNTGDLTALVTLDNKTTAIAKVINGANNTSTESFPYISGTSVAPISGTTFYGFDCPIINTQDHVAFAASLTLSTGGVTTSNDVGIFAEDGSGNLQVVARTGGGGDFNFVSLSDPVYDDSNATAFEAVYKSGTTSVVGLFCNSSGSLEQVAKTGDQAPGYASGVTFSSFSAFALPDTGGVVFVATVAGTGVTAATNTGIWIVDNTGVLRLVVHVGDALLPGKTLKAIAFLPFSSELAGQTRSFAQNGDLTFTAEFTDNSTAVFNVQFP